MSEWILAIEGTATGERVAFGLAILAAFLHAVFGALQKGRHDPWLTRGAVDACLSVIALPLVLVVPWPEPHMWAILVGAMGIHLGYKLLQAMAYDRGAYTVVYPVVRGTGPLFTVIGAYVIFGETFAGLQWVGVAVLLAGIFGLAAYNLVHVQMARETLVPALGLAIATGATVALYTTYDAYGIRATANPFTFLVWFYVVDSLIFPWVAFAHWRRLEARPALGPLILRGAFGAVVAIFSFGSVMMATRLAEVGVAAVLRETSIVFAALIGWLVLREPVGPRRLALIGLIAAGAVIVELGR